jgi:hypothetical protein
MLTKQTVFKQLADYKGDIEHKLLSISRTGHEVITDRPSVFSSTLNIALDAALQSASNFTRVPFPPNSDACSCIIVLSYSH